MPTPSTTSASRRNGSNATRHASSRTVPSDAAMPDRATTCRDSPSEEHRPSEHDRKASRVSIEINNESAIEVDEAALQRLAVYALDAMHVHPDAELAIVLVDEGAMEQLHVQWMDEPGPTDVLSFPMDELRPGTEEQPAPPGLLGDVVLCPQVAESQARSAGHSSPSAASWRPSIPRSA